MKLRNLVVGFIAVGAVAGCGIFDRKPIDLKAGATQAAALEVPPDLTAPETSQRYTIPGTDGVKVASYSDYANSKTEQPCVVPVNASTKTSVKTPAEAVPVSAPAAKLQDNNGSKSISLGEPFELGWRRVGLALDHAKLVVTDKDRILGIYYVVAVADKNNKKQPEYRVLVNKKGASSDVTVVDVNGKSDAESARLIDVIYQNLDKNYLRGDERRPSRVDAVIPAAIPVPITEPVPTAKMQENNGSKSISLGEPFDRGWRRVGLALDHAKLVTTDKDRSQGIYYIAAVPDKDNKKQPDYQVLVRKNGASSDVTVVDANGKSDVESARLIDVIYQNLDKNDRGSSRGDAVRRPR
jgi:outer membrane protein assembly factor BamC